jgi:hypothetical protein
MVSNAEIVEKGILYETPLGHLAAGLAAGAGLSRR